MQERDELRQHIARLLDQRASTVASDALALFPYAGLQPADDTSARLIDLVIQLLVAAARDGDVDARSGEVAELRRIAREKQLPIGQLFGLVYLLERTVLDELALDESFGATSEPWPVLAQVVRRASFDVLAGFCERLAQEAGDEALIDRLTTLHTRAVLLAALEKELQRSERFGHRFHVLESLLQACEFRHDFERTRGRLDEGVERTSDNVETFLAGRAEQSANNGADSNLHLHLASGIELTQQGIRFRLCRP